MPHDQGQSFQESQNAKEREVSQGGRYVDVKRLKVQYDKSCSRDLRWAFGCTLPENGPRAFGSSCGLRKFCGHRSSHTSYCGLSRKEVSNVRIHGMWAMSQGTTKVFVVLRRCGMLLARVVRVAWYITSVDWAP